MAEPDPAPQVTPSAAPAPAVARVGDTPPHGVLEFVLPPDQLARLGRCHPVASRRTGRTRSEKCRIIWHDTAAGALRQAGHALAEQDGIWQLERLFPANAASWPPATPAPVLATAHATAMLPGLPAGPLVPVAAFTGTRRSTTLSGPSQLILEVLDGQMRGVAQEMPACRVRLHGPPRAAAALAAELAQHVPLTVPRAGLAAAAQALAQGVDAGPRHLGGPAVPSGLSLDAAMTLITGHLADVILHWAPHVPAGLSPEPVHQMRVAVRRLRSALAVFRRAAPGGALRNTGAALKDLAARLGDARDWDVFLAGAAAQVQHAFPADKRITGLVTAASRKRADAYAALTAYLASPAWRQLALSLALLPSLRPWEEPASANPVPSPLAAPAEAYAAQALHRRWKHLRGNVEDFDALPPESLHELRKDAKALRYATEFFTPLFPAKPTRRFLERLVDLQEALGAVNDSFVAAALMGELSGGVDRAFAIGVVQGWVAATTAPRAEGAGRAWRKLGQQDKFWD